MSLRFALPLVVSSAILAACDVPNPETSRVAFALKQGVTVPAGVPCERIDERYRDQVAGCEIVVGQATRQQMTREELLDLNEKFSREVTTFVNFDFDKDVLRSDARAILDRQAAWITQYDDLHFSVFGHTDLVGSLDYNFDLAKRRADAVVEYLISKGASRDQLESVVSFGETKPLIQTTRREEVNRRAVTEVSGYLNLKRVSRVSVGCGALTGSYVASYPQCIDTNTPVVVAPPAPEPEPPTVVETEYGYNTNADAESSEVRGRASITDDGEGNRVTEASGDTGPEDNPRTTTFARSETSTETPSNLTANATNRHGSFGVSMNLNEDGTPDYGSVSHLD